MTSLKTAAKGTNKLNILKKYVKFRFQLIAFKTRFPIINLFKGHRRVQRLGKIGKARHLFRVGYI